MKLLFLFILVSLQPLSATAQEYKFPFPEFEKDFTGLVRLAESYAKENGDQNTYKNLTLPYAPLDISSGGKASSDKLRGYRNFAFGVFGAVFKADPHIRSKEFFCEPSSCWDERVERIHSSIKEILKLREQFLKLDKVQVVSQWNMPNRFRINNWFYNDKKTVEAKPSADLHLISSGIFENIKREDEPAARKLADSAKNIVSELRKLDLVALVRSSDGSTIVVADGFADNAWGVLVLSKEAEKKFSKPAQDDWVQVEKGIWLFRKGGRQLMAI